MLSVGLLLFAAAASQSPPPPYTGLAPSWPYKGYESFPAHFFGANASGPESLTELAFVAKHQFAGWGWEQDEDASPTSDDGHYYNGETSGAQEAARFATYIELAPPAGVKTQAIFVYRHSQMALSWYDLQRAAYNNSANDGFWKRDKNGKICVDKNRGGPTWNFSIPAAANYFVDEVIGELTREHGINSVFFDETDCEYCIEYCDGCGIPLTKEEKAALYRDKVAVLRRTAQKLNKAGIWPMYSSLNTFGGTRCPMDYSEYYSVLADVGWFRFYEFFDFSVLDNFVQETALGLPVVVRAPMTTDAAQFTSHLASFLIGQGNYSYFGTSNGWTDDGWSWHKEYDVKYGTPLGPAVKNSTGWYREFTGCSVHAASTTVASITMRGIEELSYV